MTSTTITRLWDSAVVCRRSMASLATCTAVLNPKVKSVRPRSLSIVLGTPTTSTPSPLSRCATPRVSSPPTATIASMPALLSAARARRSEEHTSELQSQSNLVCRLLLEKKKKNTTQRIDLHLTADTLVAKETNPSLTPPLSPLPPPPISILNNLHYWSNILATPYLYMYT